MPSLRKERRGMVRSKIQCFMILLLLFSFIGTAQAEELTTARSILTQLNILPRAEEKQSLTRGEMAEALCMLLNPADPEVLEYKVSEGANRLYGDNNVGIFPFDDWNPEGNRKELYFKMYRAGILKGTSRHEYSPSQPYAFEPSRPCTLGEALVFLTRSLGHVGMEHLSPVSADPFEVAAAVAEQYGLIGKSGQLDSVAASDSITVALFRCLFVPVLRMESADAFVNNIYLNYEGCAVNQYLHLNYEIGDGWATA